MFGKIIEKVTVWCSEHSPMVCSSVTTGIANFTAKNKINEVHAQNEQILEKLARMEDKIDAQHKLIVGLLFVVAIGIALQIYGFVR